MAPKKGYENFHVTLGEDPDGNPAVYMNGEIEDPKLIRDLRLLAARKKISLEKAFKLMVETGAFVMQKATPVDGGTQHG